MMFPITPLGENVLLSGLDEADDTDFLAESDDFLGLLCEEESVDFLGRVLGFGMVVDLGGK